MRSTLASILPVSASKHAAEVDFLFMSLLAISLGILLLLSFLIAYSAIRFHADSAADRTPMRLSPRKLEIAWTILPTIAFIGLFAWGAALYLENDNTSEEAEDVYVVGRQWMWEMRYPDGHRTHNRLVVPLGQATRLVMTSEDVIHSLYLPALRVKHDVVPGRYVTLSFVPTRAGTYPLYCAELCGTEHSGMTGTFTVMTPENYQQWLASATSLPSMAAAGRSLFAEKGCAGCHTPGSAVRAPLLDGLYGRSIPLKDGSFVRADEQYLHDSILLPLKQVAAGYEPLMPSYQGQLDETEVIELVEYLKSLSAQPAPLP